MFWQGIFHSFDPCMACGVHLLDAEGREINQVSVDSPIEFASPLLRFCGGKIEFTHTRSVFRTFFLRESSRKERSAMDYYLIRPSSDPKGCVLVLHAWWGLTPFFKGFCDRLAAEGFLTLAPDLYDGKTALTREEADKLRKKMGKAKATAYILDSLDALRNSASLHQGKIGLIGFSLGAYWALWLAESRPADIAAVTLFYGTRGGEYLNGNMAFQGHFAETDEFEPASSVKSLERTLRKAGKSHEFHFYPNTRHWFFESNQVGYYDEVASQLSWQRTVAFLKSHLVPA